MDSPTTDNVLADIEKQFQSMVGDQGDGFNVDDSEYRVIDSIEIGDVDDILHHESSSGEYRRNKRKPYIPRRKTKFPRSSYRRSNPTAIRSFRRSPSSERSRSTSQVGVGDSYSPRKSLERTVLILEGSNSGRSRRRSTSKVKDYSDSPRRKSKERRTVERNSVDQIRVSVKNSPLKVDNLPDLKCTTSLETGEVSVVLLSKDISKHRPKDGKDEGRKRPPNLVKNPFACASLRQKLSSSPERAKMFSAEIRPNIATERCSFEKNHAEIKSSEARGFYQDTNEKYRRESVESRSYDSCNRDFSVSPVKSRSSRRSSMYNDNERRSRRSSSRNSEKYLRRKRSRNRRTFRESNRKYSRSRENSNISSVSSRSSLSFLSTAGYSADEYDRKSSPLRSNNAYIESTRNHDKISNFSNSDDFNLKLNVLLSERKNNQLSIGNESGSPLSSNYNNWKYENWTNSGSGLYNQYQDVGVNYSDDIVVKPYDQQQEHHNVYIQDQYNQIPNQYYSQPPAAINFPSTSYYDHGKSTQYPTVMSSEEPFLVNSISQHASNVSQQQYSLQEQCNLVPVNPSPIVEKKSDRFVEVSQNEHYSCNRSVPYVDSNTVPSPKVDESDEEDAPPPPVILNAWREIESADKNSWIDSEQKWSVLGKCESLLKKLMSNDPSMEHFKFPELLQFSVVEEIKNTSNSTSQNSVQGESRLSEILHYRSPLLRSGYNPQLKFEPWIPEG